MGNNGKPLKTLWIATGVKALRTLMYLMVPDAPGMFGGTVFEVD
jgi:hypothetical protein